MPTHALHREDAYLRECTALVTHIADDGVELDRTVFYATSGGQAADHGVLRLADGSPIAVIDRARAGATAPPRMTRCTCSTRPVAGGSG